MRTRRTSEGPPGELSRCCYCGRTIARSEPRLYVFDLIADICACVECAKARQIAIEVLWEQIEDLAGREDPGKDEGS